MTGYAIPGNLSGVERVLSAEFFEVIERNELFVGQLMAALDQVSKYTAGVGSQRSPSDIDMTLFGKTVYEKPEVEPTEDELWEDQQ